MHCWSFFYNLQHGLLSNILHTTSPLFLWWKLTFKVLTPNNTTHNGGTLRDEWQDTHQSHTAGSVVLRATGLPNRAHLNKGMFNLGPYWSLSAFNFLKEVWSAGTSANEKTTQSAYSGYPVDCVLCWGPTRNKSRRMEVKQAQPISSSSIFGGCSRML